MIPSLPRSSHPVNEFFADEFACALLMPIEDVKRQVQAGTGFEDMALRYDVPITAVKGWVERLERHPK